ncbi:MAG: hypothetical protein H6728_11980 [Myxococcales bacterium]|nr:hypothetical protein [Myxococcales bacterium]
MAKVGGPGPQIPQIGINQQANIQQTQAPQTTPQQQLQALQQGVQQAFQGMVGAAMQLQGQIPGSSGTQRSMLGVVNNPAALFAQAQVGAQMGAQLQAMSGFALQAMNAMGLGQLPQAQQMGMLNSLGQQMFQQAQGMGSMAFAQGVMPMIPGMTQALGNFAASGLNRGQLEGMGGQFLSTLGQMPSTHWGREALGSLGPQYFNNFDPRSLAAMPDAGISSFANQMLGMAQQASPLQLGQQMQQMLDPQQLGQQLLQGLPPGMMQQLGDQLLPMLQQNPQGLGEALLQNVGMPALQNIGQNLFNNIPGLAQTPAGDLAGQLLGALGQGGDIKQNLMGAAGNFLKDQLLGPNGKLSQIGQNLLGKLGNGIIGKAGKTVMDLIGKGKSLGDLGKGLLDKFGGKVLDKLGGAGKVLGGALSLLNGEFTPAKALKMGLSLIPGFGQAFAALSAIPGVGQVIDKILGGVGKVLEKIPGVSQLFKGLNKVTGFIGKGVGKVVDGIKNVGKKILGGVGKLVGKI